MRIPLILILGAGTAWGQLALDHTSNSTDTTSGTITWSHTVTGSTKNALIVTVSSANNNGGSGPARTVTGITWNGVALPGVTISQHSGTREDVDIWCVAGVATGTGNIVVTLSGTYDHASASAFSFTGVDQTTPCKNDTGTGKTTGATGSPSTVTVPSVTAGNWAVAALTLGKGNGNATSVTSPTTQNYLLNLGVNSFAGSVQTSSYITGLTAGSNPISWTWNVSGTNTFWQAAAVEVNQAAVCLFSNPAGAQNLAPINQVYNTFTPTLNGCVAPTTFSITSGALPTGLSLNTSTGAVTGTPTGTAGTSSFTLHVVDTNSNVDSQADSIKTVNQIITSTSCASNSPTSVLCTWGTTVAADSKVVCGTTAGDGTNPGGTVYSTPTVNPVQFGVGNFYGVTSHSVVITGLPNNTATNAYFCVAHSADQADGGDFHSLEKQVGTAAAITATPFVMADVSAPVRVSDQVSGLNGMPNTSFWVNGDTNYCTILGSGSYLCTCEDCGGVGSTTGFNTQVLLWNSAHTSATNVVNWTGDAGSAPVYPIGNSKFGSSGVINVGGTVYGTDGIFNANSFNYCCQQVFKTTDNFTTSIGLAHNTGSGATPVSGIDFNPVGVITASSISGSTVTLKTTANIPVGTPISVIQVTCSPTSPCINGPGAGQFATYTVASSSASQLTYDCPSCVGATITSTGNNYTVSGATWSSTGGGTFVFTTSTQSPLVTVNEWVSVGGVSPAGYNVTCEATAVSSTSVTCVKASTNPGTFSSAGNMIGATGANAYVFAGNWNGYWLIHWLQCDGTAYACTSYAGMDGWVYAYIDISINLIGAGTYLGRIRIEDMALTDLSKWQIYKGAHDASDDGLYDANWDTTTGKFSNGTIFSDDPFIFRKYGSKISGLFVSGFNGWLVTIQTDNYGGFNSGGAGAYYAKYPWNPLTYAGKIDRRVTAFQSYMPAFPHPLPGSFHQTNTNPLTVSGTVITSGVADMIGTTGANDNYTTWLRYISLVPSGANASRPKLGRGQRRHNQTGLDLLYTFTDNQLGSRTLKDSASAAGTNTVTGLADASVLNLDKFGMFNFGIPTSQNGSNNVWQSPKNYSMTTPYVATLSAFTNATCFGQVPGKTVQPNVSNQIVVSKSGDFVIRRTGTADTWDVIVKGTTIGAVPVTDNAIDCIVTTRDGSGHVALYNSSGLTQAPLTTVATGTATGAFSSSAFTLGDGTASLHGVMVLEAWWSRALAADELVDEMSAIKNEVGNRGITLANSGGGGGGSLSLSTLTNSQLSTLTNSQLSTLGN